MSATTAVRDLIQSIRGIDSAILIVFYGRSGSLLLNSFLDHHPALLDIPWDNFSVNYQNLLDRFETLRTQSPEQIADEVVQLFPILFDHNHRDPAFIHRINYSLEGEQVGVEQEPFCRLLATVLRDWGSLVSPNDLIKAIYVVFNFLKHGEARLACKKLLIQLHTCRHELIPELVKGYRSTHLLIAMRNPIQAFDSYLYHVLKRCYVAEHSRIVFDLLQEVKETPFLTPALDGVQVAAVRFEDLHRNLPAVMKSLAAWLSIDWDPILLESTLNGVPWGLSVDGKVVKGVDPKRAEDRACRMLSRLDRYKLSRFFDRELCQYGYPAAKERFYDRFLYRLALLIPFRVHIELLLREITWQKARYFHESYRKTRQYMQSRDARESSLSQKLL